MKNGACSRIVIGVLATAIGASVLAQDRPVSTFFYDNNGNLTTSVDGLNRPTTKQYDALNRLRRITGPVPAPLQPNPVIQIDVNGGNDLTRVIDPRNLPTVYTVNGLGDVTDQSSPDTGVTVRTFKPGGQIATSRDARGRTTTYSYDDLNRLTEADYGDGTATIYGYDQGTNGKGRLTSMTDPGGIATAWSYDLHGRVLTKSQTIGSVNHQVAYSYNSTTGKMLSMTYPSGRVITYSYGVASKDLEIVSLDGTPIASSIAYHPFGGVKSLTLGNGQAWSNSLDQDGRVTSYSLGGVTYTLTWDAANRVTTITHATDTFWNRDYGYDNLDRITSFSSTPRSQSFVYDLTGNLTGKADVIDGGDPVNHTYNIVATSNRMTAIASHGIGYSFDQSGNRTDDGRISFTYNARGRLARATITDGAFSYPIDYLVNGLNLRVRKSGPAEFVPNGTNIFVFDEGAKLIGEYDGLGRARAEHIWLEHRPIAVVTYTYDGEEPTPTSSSISYVETDHLATPRLVTNADRAPRWFWHSAPYGDTFPHEDPSSIGSFSYNLRFPGQYFDSETNLAYNHHRDYEPTSGRYVQSDPIGLAGGINTYLYAKAAPTKYIDPTGNAATLTWCFGGPIPCAIGGAVAVGTAIWAGQASQGGNIIPFPPGGREGQRDGSDVGTCHAPQPDRDPECVTTGLAGFSATGQYGGHLTCQYRCPRKGLQHFTVQIAFTPAEPRYLCRPTVPESFF